MPLLESTIPGLLADRAREQPDDLAYTFLDYDVDPAGLLTFSDDSSGTINKIGYRP